MNEKLTYAVLFAVVLLIIALLAWIIHLMKGKSSAKKTGPSRSDAAAMGLLVNCPLCNTPLLKGQNLVTKVYRPMTVSDQLCTINGCPHCFPRPEPGIKRQCPVCHKEVPLDGHLTARLFNKTDGKKHVVVTGCSECCVH
ncbi:MAG: hypothetical protein IIT68_03995 [Treponema sp.]|nr:hypothetical protein [Treponema sp.]